MSKVSFYPGYLSKHCANLTIPLNQVVNILVLGNLRSDFFYSIAQTCTLPDSNTCLMFSQMCFCICGFMGKLAHCDCHIHHQCNRAKCSNFPHFIFSFQIKKSTSRAASLLTLYIHFYLWSFCFKLVFITDIFLSNEHVANQITKPFLHKYTLTFCFMNVNDRCMFLVY